jgi:hypothetical protein
MQPLLMPQVMQLTGGGGLTIPVWYNGTIWTKLGGGTGRNYHRKGVVLNGSFIASDYSLGSIFYI